MSADQGKKISGREKLAANQREGTRLKLKIMEPRRRGSFEFIRLPITNLVSIRVYSRNSRLLFLSA
jgi:hypothetical protein